MTEGAKTYGGALYELSVEENTSAETLEELGAIRSLFLENPQFSKLLLTPTLQKEERLAVIDNTFGGKVQQNVVNFLKILTENGTVNQFPECTEEFKARYCQDKGIEEVTAVTAVPLSSQLAQQLKEKLEAMTGKTILLQNKVEPAILGGVRLEMQGAQYEGSVKQQLEALRQSLLEAKA